ILPSARVLQNPGGFPRLAQERVLIIQDGASGTEHFVREVRFDRAADTFGFVVPTPASPELAKVSSPPWAILEKAFPFEPPPQQPATHSKGAKGARGLDSNAAVSVVSVQRIGSFTATVLTATDATALDKWLADNGVALPPGGKEWLAHYVGLKFFFTAFKYD